MPAKASFKKAVPPEEVIEAKKQQIESLQLQCNAVERMLAICTDQQRRVDAEIKGTTRQIAVAQQRQDELDRSLDESVHYMINMAKATDDQLRQRREALQKTAADAERENAAIRLKLEEVTQRKQAELRKWQGEVETLQQHIDEKALIFGMKLKETLDRMQPNSSAEATALRV